MASLSFPTPLHEEVANLACDFFAKRPLVDTVLIVNSCARGKATPQSDLDIAVLSVPGATAQEIEQLDAAWRSFADTDQQVTEFRCSGRFAAVHLDIFDGRFTAADWDDGGGPDAFEIEIGNRVAYAAPFGEPGAHFQHLQTRWLPYYGEELRARRRQMTRAACVADLERASFYVNRNLHFAAFDYFYKGFREFLQSVFIARSTYPLSYTKWIREQVAEILAMPDLYRELPSLLSVNDFESAELGENIMRLRQLLDRWVAPTPR
jgi:predicted nucleotidyltransferase